MCNITINLLTLLRIYGIITVQFIESRIYLALCAVIAKGSDRFVSCLKDCSDKELICLIRSGNKAAEDAIVKKYFGMAVYFSGVYFIPGGDSDDVVQEGLIGLLEAVRSFDLKKNVSFSSFAAMCISRKIISAIRSAAAKKHTPLNTYTSLDGYCDACGNPEDVVINRESFDSIRLRIDRTLSQLEREVLFCFLGDMSYSEIALRLGKCEKAVDNALSRSRRKLNLLFRG